MNQPFPKPPELPSGWLHNLPDHEYHSDPATISSSGLRKILKSPAHFQAYLERPESSTQALDIGKAVHCLVLQPELYPEQFAVSPEINRRTKAGKQEYADFQEASEAKTILIPKDNLVAQQTAAGVRAHTLTAELFSGGKAEVSGYYQDAETGTWCRIRPDYLRIKDGMIVDLKTSIDASPNGFKSSINKYGYHFQAAMYAAGFEAITGEPLQHFLFVVVEKSPPFAAAVYRADETMLAIGMQQYRRALRIYAECSAAGIWPGYSSQIETIGLPDWVITQSLDEDDE